MHRDGQTLPSSTLRTYTGVLSLIVVFLLLCVGCMRSAPYRGGAHRTAAPVRATAAADLYLLQDVQPSSQRDVTYVVMTVNGPVQPLVQRLAAPDRLTIDLPVTQLGAHSPRQDLTVDDGRLQAIQITQSVPDNVRITLSLQAIQDYRVLVRSAPHRVVVALHGGVAVTRVPPPAREAPLEAPVKTPPLRAALPPPPRASRGNPVIVIDPGHGGHDPGAIGPTGFDEKTAVLQIAKELRQLLQRELPKHRIVMTREDDVFIPLGERARLANMQQAQLFISIHANSSPNPEAQGIETWYLSFAASARAKKIAARENMMSEKQVSTLELILRDMHETDRINQSAVLARVTQDAVTGYVATQYAGVQKRGVEGAPFAVLHRTTMPSILVETAFISNPQEEARLRTPQYQRALAQGILRGLRHFLQTTVVASQ
ncbi:MAG: N-acetylmuramoyl-L-alanine amidase [Candidatus Tectimicrobiota bacterium]